MQQLKPPYTNDKMKDVMSKKRLNEVLENTALQYFSYNYDHKEI